MVPNSVFIIAYSFWHIIIVTLFIHDWLDEKNIFKVVVARIMSFIAIIASLYILYSGLSLISGWENPIPSIEIDEGARTSVSAKSRGRGGLLLLIIPIITAIWPFILIAFGSFSAYMFSNSMKKHFLKRNS